MGFYGKWDTYKVVYNLASHLRNGFNQKGVALVEAGDIAHASTVFKEQYAGQFSTVDTIEKLFD